MKTNNILVLLSKNRLNEKECDIINDYVNKEAEWDWLVGQLLFHKLHCRAYHHLNEHGWIKSIPPALMYPLKKLFELNKYREGLRNTYTKDLIVKLNNGKIRYCFIKGALLEMDLFYNSGRETNDTDVLIHSSDLKVIDNILTGLGYERGIYDSKTISVTADRKLDVFNIMNTHQTVPYCKLTGNTLIKTNMVDVQFNFTLQNKLGYSIDIDQVLDNRIPKNWNGETCYSLNIFDSFLLLCTHLYGEAVLIQEIRKGKDIQLIKFADIYEWIEKYFYFFNWNEKINDIISNGFIKPVLYCVYIVLNLYESKYAETIYSKFLIQGHDIDFVDDYFDDTGNTRKWEVPVMERIFKPLFFSKIE